MAAEQRNTILLVADRRSSQTSRVLQRAGFAVVATFTVDRAVALCVNRDYHCVVLDQEMFIETDGWSVAQSLKLIRPSLCVLLITRGTLLRGRPPKGVDLLVPQQRLERLPDLIADLKRPEAAGY